MAPQQEEKIERARKIAMKKMDFIRHFLIYAVVMVVLAIINNSRIDTDGAQGIILSVFFGLGLLLLTFLQKKPIASQAGLDKFLFGQAAAILPSDVRAMSIFGGVALLLLIIFWKCVLTFIMGKPTQ